MKTIHKQSILMCALLFCILGCNSDKKSTQGSNAKIIAAEAPCNGVLLSGEDYEKNRKIAKYQISQYEEKYEDLINKKSTDANFLSKGAKVEDINELYELVCHMRNTGGELYIMNAIKKAKDSLGNIVDVTDMIFVVVPPSKSDTISTSNTKLVSDPNIYLNFTQPCPAACPTIE